MAKDNGQWKVLDHGPIEELSDNLWWVQGALPKTPLKRAMTIARLDDGGLVVHNAIALGEEAMSRIEAFGTPKYLVVPSGFHRLDAAAFKQRYPELRVYAPKGSRAKVEQVVAVDGAYEEFPNNDTVSLETLHGLRELEGAMIVRSADGVTVVLNDAVFNMDRSGGLMGFVFGTMLGSAPGPRVSRLTKLMMVDNRNSFRADLERYAALPELTRLIVAHDKVAKGVDAAAALRKAASYL